MTSVGVTDPKFLLVFFWAFFCVWANAEWIDVGRSVMCVKNFSSPPSEQFVTERDFSLLIFSQFFPPTWQQMSDFQKVGKAYPPHYKKPSPSPKPHHFGSKFPSYLFFFSLVCKWQIKKYYVLIFFADIKVFSWEPGVFDRANFLRKAQRQIDHTLHYSV